MVSSRSRTISKKRRRTSFGANKSGVYASSAPRGFSAVPSSEVKFLDTSIADVSTTQAGVILNSGSINVIPQGVTESERVGRKCVVRSIHIKGKVRLGVTATSSEACNLYRIIVYQDKQCNKATAAITDLLQTADILSFRNLENSGRFNFLYDKTRAINASAGAGNGTTNTFAETFHYFSFNKKCNIPLEFTNTASTGAIGTITSNNLGMAIFCQDTAVAPVCQFEVRIRFSDK